MMFESLGFAALFMLLLAVVVVSGFMIVMAMKNTIAKTKRFSLAILAVLAATLLTSTASAHEPFPLATAFFRARANVAALRVARAQQPIVVQKVVKQQVVQQFVQPAYVAPIVQQYQAFVAPTYSYQVAPVQAYVAPVQAFQVQKVQAVQSHGCAAFFSRGY